MAPIAAKSSTAFWKETTAITKDVAKEGRIAHAVSGWKCDHYKVKVRRKAASRMASKLSGDAGFRDVCKGITGIAICLRVSSNVADRAKIKMAAKATKKIRKSSLSAAGQVIASEEGDLRA